MLDQPICRKFLSQGLETWIQVQDQILSYTDYTSRSWSFFSYKEYYTQSDVVSVFAIDFVETEVDYYLPLALVYAPCMSFMSEWFVQRRGMANGIMFAGTLPT